ncbi:hypothetical protein HOLleu_43293 [Holothuria leucospilota]|uniref:Uncharacterized protein n=1 Tax=Holothuria leucospilota TaxID=206669 RepID=A0A9Q1B9S0_HOLLE|nr:hypothetical protein HOLleu_43293 [Holothuria leucospilota]
MDLLDYEEEEVHSLPNATEQSQATTLASSSGEGTSKVDTDYKSMLLQMQAQIKLLSEKLVPAVNVKPPTHEVDDSPFPANQEALHASPFGEKEDSEHFDLDNDLEDLLSGSTKEPDICSLDAGEQVFGDITAELNLAQENGPKVQDKVATLVSNICKAKLKPAKIKEKCSKYLRPENVELLETTHCNKPIWDHLQMATRTRDMKLQKIQTLNVKAMSALTSLLNDCVGSKAIMDKDTLLINVADALALLGSANVDLNAFRRDLMRPELKAEYKTLCDKNTEFESSKYLFGDNITQQLRDISDANKISKRCMAPSRGRSRGFGRSKFTGRGRTHRYQPFLGNRQGRQYYNRPLPKGPNTMANKNSKN